jgi:hypothetical protein
MYTLIATKGKKDVPYIASCIPGTKTVLVKKKGYKKNLADVGFQFERYVTGGDMMTTDASSVEAHPHNESQH